MYRVVEKRNGRALMAISLIALGLSGCSSGGTSGGGTKFSDLLLLGTAPAPAPMSEPEQQYDCPSVDIREGGGVRRDGAGSAVRLQFSIRNVARECRLTDAGVFMKIGIEGVAIIGASGTPGAVSTPITIVVSRNEKPVLTRVVQAKSVITSDENQGLFRIIEDGIGIPQGPDDVTVTVGFKG
jgi:hypothetical protein